MFLGKSTKKKQSAKTLIKVDRRAADKFYDEQTRWTPRLENSQGTLGIAEQWNGLDAQTPESQVPQHPGHKRLQFIAHLPTKYHPIPGRRATLRGLLPSTVHGTVGVTLQHVPLHI